MNSILQYFDHRKLLKLHNQAMYLLNKGSFEDCRIISKKIIEKLSADNKQPASKKLFNLKLIHANAHCFHAQSLEQLHPDDPSNLDIIIDNYKRAVELIEYDKSSQPTLFTALSSLALSLLEKSVKQGVSFIDEAYSHLIHAKKIMDSFPPSHGQRLEQMITLSKISMCHAEDIHGNSVYNIDKAIECITTSHDFFNTNNDKENLTTAKYHLAQYYSQRSADGVNRQDIDRAILYFQEVIVLLPPDDPMLAAALSQFGRLNFLRKKTFSQEGIEGAFAILNYTHGMIDPEKNPIEWSNVGLDLIEALLDRKDIQSAVKHSNDVKNILYDLIDKVFNLLNKKYNVGIMYRTLSLKKRVFSLYKEYTRGQNLKPLIKLIEVTKHDENKYGHIYVEAQLSRIEEENGKNTLAILEETLSNVSVHRWPEYCIDIHIKLGFCYVSKIKVEKALANFNAALSLLIPFKENRDRNSILKIRRMLRSSDLSLFLIPKVILELEAPLRALFFMEHMRFHPITPILEELLVIEKQIDRKYWMYQHKRTKQEEVFFQKAPKFEEWDEFSDSEMEEFKLSYLSRIDKKRDNLHKIDGYYKNIDELIKKNINFTENHFISNLKNNIKCFSSWVLIPFIGEEEIRLCLIPPYATGGSLILSKPISSGYYDILKNIASDEHGSWIKNSIYFSSCMKEIDNNKNYNREEKEDSFEKLEAEMFHAFDKMGAYLWNVFGRWIVARLKSYPTEDTRSLVIIAQGPLALLPFCLAKNPENEEYLLDYVDISYVPSLYTLYSLQERLKQWKYPAKLGFFSPDNSDNDLESGQNSDDLICLPIERELSCLSFNKALGQEAKSCPMTGREMIELCYESTHWHFVTHGKFDYNDFTKAYIEFGDPQDNSNENNRELIPEVLSCFESKDFLRLVVLAACQTGLSEVLDKELSPESFLTELLKCGTIGAIGTLWEVQEEPTALILGRFYHYHIVEDQMPAIALASAQKWLKGISCQELCEFIRCSLINKGKCLNVSKQLISDLKNDFNDDDLPFSHPWFWAGFVLMGI